MKQIVVLIFIVFTFVCNGQTPEANLSDINHKDVVEIKGIIYLRSDTTLVTGRIIHYNRKNKAKRYVIVRNGKHDGLGWIKLNNGKVIEPKESVVGAVLASAFIAPYVSEVKKDNDIPINTNNSIQQISASNFIEYNKKKYQKAYSDMSVRNDISKVLSIEKKASIETVKEYDEDGQLKINENSIDVKRNGTWEEYYPNGKLKSKGFYIEGMKDGRWKEYYENGQLNYKGSFIKGNKDGFWKEYYPNGQLKSKGSYLNGKYMAGWIYFDDAGKTLLMEYYN